MYGWICELVGGISVWESLPRSDEDPRTRVPRLPARASEPAAWVECLRCQCRPMVACTRQCPNCLCEVVLASLYKSSTSRHYMVRRLGLSSLPVQDRSTPQSRSTTLPRHPHRRRSSTTSAIGTTDTTVRDMAHHGSTRSVFHSVALTNSSTYVRLDL